MALASWCGPLSACLPVLFLEMSVCIGSRSDDHPSRASARDGPRTTYADDKCLFLGKMWCKSTICCDLGFDARGRWRGRARSELT